MDRQRTRSLATPAITGFSRRVALRGLGGVGAAILATSVAGVARAETVGRRAHAMSVPAAADDPAAVVEAYVEAVNAADLEGILALYADDAVHIFLPTADGSAGVCHGKDQFRMWYEMSLANGDRIEIPDGALAVDGNQAAFVTRITSDPWRELGLDSLDAHSELVVIDGRIATHVVALSPESMRTLQSARGASAGPTTGREAATVALPNVVVGPH